MKMDPKKKMVVVGLAAVFAFFVLIYVGGIITAGARDWLNGAVDSSLGPVVQKHRIACDVTVKDSLWTHLLWTPSAKLTIEDATCWVEGPCVANAFAPLGFISESGKVKVSAGGYTGSVDMRVFTASSQHFSVSVCTHEGVTKGSVSIFNDKGVQLDSKTFEAVSG